MDAADAAAGNDGAAAGGPADAAPPEAPSTPGTSDAGAVVADSADVEERVIGRVAGSGSFVSCTSEL